MAAVPSETVETGPDATPATEEKAYILEAIWFRKGHGAQRYREYLTNASPIASRYGARRVDALFRVEALRGDFEPDYICVIEWPNIEAYYTFLKDIHYRVIAPIKEEAIAKVTTIHCRRAG